MKSLDARGITRQVRSVGRIRAAVEVHRRARSIGRRRNPDLRGEPRSSRAQAVVRNFFAEQGVFGED